MKERGKYTKRILVLGHSDIETKRVDAIFLKKLGIKRLFATNNYPLDFFSESIPLGITNDCDDSPIHRLLGDESHFLKANNVDFLSEFFEPTIYINFSSGNNRGVREQVLSLATKIPHLYRFTVQTPDFTDKGRISYLGKLRSHGMVLCPEGNGIDTHRFWETLYMGGVPVVTSNKAMQSLYDNLPVIQLHSWVELSDRSRVEELWWKVMHKDYDFDRLTMDFWLKRFKT